VRFIQPTLELREMSKRNILNKWLWKQAEKVADDPEWNVETANAGTGLLPHLKRVKVKAAYVYPALFGGWMGDVELKNMPLGFANVLGTAVSYPAKTEDEARQTIISILAAVIRAEGIDHADSDGAPVFPFHNLLVPLSSNVFKIMEQEGFDVCWEQFEYSMGRLVDMEELFRGDYSPQKFKSFDIDSQKTFQSVIHNARYQGIMRWPESQPLSPSGHQYESAAIN
jgi:hypothetical protein